MLPYVSNILLNTKEILSNEHNDGRLGDPDDSHNSSSSTNISSRDWIYQSSSRHQQIQRKNKVKNHQNRAGAS